MAAILLRFAGLDAVLIIWHLFVEDLSAIPQAPREIALAFPFPVC
jgi:hypothetical protein